MITIALLGTNPLLAPELRAEREAPSLIHFLRDQGQPQSEWLASLTADQPVRQRALQFVRDCEALADEQSNVSSS